MTTAELMPLPSEKHYPQEVVSVLERACLEVLAEGFSVSGHLAGTRFQPDEEPLGDMTVVLSFQGPSVAGRVVVTGEERTFRRVRTTCFGAAGETSVSEVHDLAGEIANQVVGRLKSYFVSHGMPFSLGLPMLIRGAGAMLRHSQLRPALVVETASPCGPVFVELCFTQLDLESATEGEIADAEALECGELSFF